MSLPLLLTGTIDSGVYNNTGNIFTDISERLMQYESSISRYITETPFDKIVFIENSGFHFDEQRFSELAKENGKTFEFIQGTICKEEILKHGKSFGDAFLIHEGLKKSKLLADEKFFYKMTGRIFLKNSYEMVRTSQKKQNEFIVYPGIHWCLTYFFKANKKDYLRVLDDIYLECDELSVRDIEISFYYRLKKAHECGEIKVQSFSAFPIIDGRMGATGANYSGGRVIQFALNMLAYWGVFSFDSLPSRVFWTVYRWIKPRDGY